MDINFENQWYYKILIELSNVIRVKHDIKKKNFET